MSAPPFWEMLPCGLSMAKCLDVSTRHISKRDDELLHLECEASSPTIITYRKERGFFVYVSYNNVQMKEKLCLDAGYSLGFIQILRIAREEGASWVCIDADGTETDTLSVFTW